MTGDIQHKRVEILVDQPLLKTICKAAEEVDITGYTVLPTLGGAGGDGTWSDERVTGGAGTKVMFLTITTKDKATAIAEALAPILESYGLMIMISDVEVIRKQKF